MYTVVTNNPYVKREYEGKDANLKIEFVESENCLKVLETVRNHMHQGMRLETHPMAGSVKPNQNPYKSIIISDDKNDYEEENQRLIVIENAIMVCREFLEKKALPKWDEKLLEDFQYVDNSLITSGIQRILS